MRGERSRNAFATPSVRLTAPGPSVDTHTPGLRSICPLASAMNAATASWRTRMNSMPTARAASMKSRISPPGRPYIRSTPASRSVLASTSAHVGMTGEYNRAPMAHADHSRRQFIGYFSSIGLSTTLLPGTLWAEMQEQRATKVTPEMLKHALDVAGLDFTNEQRDAILNGVNQNLTRYSELRAIHIDPNLAPPLYYSPLVPGTKLDRAVRPFKPSAPKAVKRPANLEDVAFWPVADLAQLIKTRQVTSVDLTKMYLERLHRYNGTLNFVVTFTDDLAMRQAQEADKEIASGKYRGPLHGIPWGCKDIIAVPGYPTQWGSGAYKGQVINVEATVVKLLREAGAVMLAKLTTGELA